MSRLSRQRAKEKFLNRVEQVDKDLVLEELRNADSCDDLYTYFVSKNSFATDIIEEKNIAEFLQKAYADWYFLHKNHKSKEQPNILLRDFTYAPICLSVERCMNLIKMGEYEDILPIRIQYINKLEEKYFVVIDTHKLYNKEFKDYANEVRLYVNLPANQILEFGKEFLDKAYLEEFPATIKLLNNDHRADTIIIYTDYEYASSVVRVINEIRQENRGMFERVGIPCCLLGVIDDIIGFGEQLDNGGTYFNSRCLALSNIQNYASHTKIKEGIVAEEKKIVFRKDGSSFTPTEYLSYLIEKNAIALVEKRIAQLERIGHDGTAELERLYSIRDNVSIGLDLSQEVNKLKKSLTRKGEYRLVMENIGTDEFDFVSKLYRLFTTEDERILKNRSDRQKKCIISNKLFTVTEEFEGVNTREFLDAYFKTEIALLLKETLDEELTEVKRSRQSQVIANIKKKACLRLKSILSSILDDGEEGREYIGLAVNDYIRILSTDAVENVEVTIDNKTISIDKDINTDIISLLPRLQEEVRKLSLDNDFIDNTLNDFGINKDNLCLNNKTKNIHKEKSEKVEVESRYYYNPDGYLSK